jgi:photosystem II stability/assembly factor-like uncharacterized protein
MPSIIKENLRFFDKTGSDISPILTDGVWTGLIRIPDASVGLHEVGHIFIAEDVIDTTNIITRNANTVQNSPIITFTNGTTKGIKPNMWIQGNNIPSDALVSSVKNPTQLFLTEGATLTGSTTVDLHRKKYEITYPRSSGSKIRARLETTNTDIFFLFDVSFEADMPVIQKLSEFLFTLEDGSSDTTIFNHRNLNPSEINKQVAQINIASVAKNDGAYYNNLLVEEIDEDGTITALANFQLEFAAEGEDERFRSMLENFGNSIDSRDYVAFRDTDIKEERIDYKQLNIKRKEMLLSGGDIWPYLGSYKGLVNALKYFGYGDLRLKEYWLNVSESSKNEGKFVTMNVPLSLEYSDSEFKYYKQFIDGIVPNQPSKTFQKTAKFALFYDLNRDSGEYDEDGLPITEDVFEFTNEEILIKLFSLKNILKEKFLPLNARIIDITGEGVYYDNIGLNSWNIPTPTFHINVESEIDFSGTPLLGYLSDKTNSFFSSCDITTSTKLSDKETIGAVNYAYCIIGNDVDENNLEIVPSHPRYSKKVGLSVTLQNLTNDYTWEELSTSWENASDRNWIDLKYRDFQTMRWIIRSVSKNEIIYDKKSDVGILDEIEVVLPYLGYYDVTLELIDHFNFPHRQTKKNYIEVKPREADMIAVFRKHDDFYTWEDIEDTESDLALADMHGTWMDITINEETNWVEAGDITWEALDWSTYANQNNLFDYLTDATSSVPDLTNDTVGQVTGLLPENHKVKVSGINNSILQKTKRYNALFLKDRTKANNTVLKITGNEIGPTISSRQFTNNDVFFIDKDTGWIVGNNGKFIYTTNGGTKWEIEPLTSSDNLNSVHFTSKSNGWVVGDFGTVYHYYVSPSNEKSVTKINVNTNNTLNSVYFIDENIGFIAGNGIILKTTNGGVNWSNIMPSGLTDNVVSIKFAYVALGLAVTEQGKILRTTDGGNNWSIDDRSPYSFRDVEFYDNNFAWAVSYDTSTEFNQKIFRSIDGGLTWDEHFTPTELYSVSFYNSIIGFASGKFNTAFKTLNGGVSWIPAYYEIGLGPITSNNLILKSIFAADSLTIYTVGTNGYILKTSNGGFVFSSPNPPPSNWISQKSNQVDYISGSNSNVWLTEPYSGKILKNERGVIAIKHIAETINWTGVNTLTTTWQLGSLQSALNATEIYFQLPDGSRKQYSIQSSKLTITNEIEYILHQYIYDTTELDVCYVFQSYASVIIDSEPINVAGGLRLTWKDIWTNERVPALSNMYLILKLESKDLFCDILDFTLDGNDTILTMDWNCDVISKLDSDYSVVIKEYNIERASTKLSSINRNWETYCENVLWQDMGDKTWNDFEFNGLSYCGYTISKVSRGGTIIVDNEHFFQFPPEKLIEIEGNLTDGDAYIDLDGLIAIKSGLINGNDFIESNVYWALSSSGDGTNLANGNAAKIVYTGNKYSNDYLVFRVLGKYETTQLGNGIIENNSLTLGVIFNGVNNKLTSDTNKKSFSKSCDISNSSLIKSCDTTENSETISTISTSNLSSGMLVSGSGIPSGSKIVSIANSITFTKSCDTTLNDIIITTASTNDLIVGMIVSGSGIPSGSKIISIVNLTSFTIDNLATATATGVSLTFEYNTFTIDNVATATATGVSLTFEYDTIITSTNTQDLDIGMIVTGTGIPAFSKITSIIDSTTFTIDNVATTTGSGVSLLFELFNTSAPILNLNSQVNIEGIIYPNMIDLEIGMIVHGDGIPLGSIITYIDGVNPYTPNRILISNSATKTGTSLLSLSTASITLDEAVEYLNNSDIDGIRDFYYSRPLLTDGITYADYILGKAKFPGVGALHYFKFLYGVESDWEDSPYETHSYPLGQMKDWTKAEEDGGEPLGENNPPLWNYLYNTYYELGEWFPVPEKLGEFNESIESIRALYSQALDGSFNWQDTMIKKWKSLVSPGTTVFLSSFPSKIVGIRNHYWKIYDSRNILMYETSNDFLIWTFCDPGTYTIELKITDISGNSYLVRRNGFIEVKSPKIINHELPGLGWSPPNLPPDLLQIPSVVPPLVLQPPFEMVVPPLVSGSNDVVVGNTPIPDSPSTEPPAYSDISSGLGSPAYTYEFRVISVNQLISIDAIENSVTTLQFAEIIVAWDNKDIKNESLSVNEFYVDYYDSENRLLTKRIEAEAQSFYGNQLPDDLTTSKFLLRDENARDYISLGSQIARLYILPRTKSI